MPQIKRLLFPVDFSASCFGTVQHVRIFAEHFGAETILVHAAGTKDRPASRHEVSRARAKLDQLIASEMSTLNTQIICTPADPTSLISEVTYSYKPDLVMMPTRGRGDYRRYLLGSVTAKVLHDSHCPVWTSVHAESSLTADKIEYRRVLCAVEIAEQSEHILEWAKWLAAEYGSSLGIVHVMADVDPSFFPAHVDPALGELGSAYGRYVAEQAEKKLAILQSKVGSAAEVFVVPGSPRIAVPDVATCFKADMAIIGRRSGESIAHDIFHDVSAIVRDMPCPVISI